MQAVLKFRPIDSVQLVWVLKSFRRKSIYIFKKYSILKKPFVWIELSQIRMLLTKIFVIFLNQLNNNPFNSEYKLVFLNLILWMEKFFKSLCSFINKSVYKFEEIKWSYQSKNKKRLLWNSFFILFLIKIKIEV